MLIIPNKLVIIELKIDDEQFMPRSFIFSSFFYCFQMKSNEDKKNKK